MWSSPGSWSRIDGAETHVLHQQPKSLAYTTPTLHSPHACGAQSRMANRGADVAQSRAWARCWRWGCAGLPLPGPRVQVFPGPEVGPGGGSRGVLGALDVQGCCGGGWIRVGMFGCFEVLLVSLRVKVGGARHGGITTARLTPAEVVYPDV
ncbi:hypothetical protein EJ07DRAFT_156437 [Lizonia empirigonia]|nr:hypothetical protein EJ07DRAFT_156437 [Lizonia empirigonia]